MKKTFFKNTFLGLVIACIGFTACSGDDDSTTEDSSTDDDSMVVNVKEENFTGVTITTVPCTLSDGTTGECYQIVTTSAPSDHQMGPWCPTNISDDASAGGIWLENGEVYDVDGAFIQNLATFYNDNTWQMYNTTTGEITVTETEEDCINAANPNVGSAYENFCVECLPSYITDVTQTWLIPITPKYASTATTFATGPGGMGNNVPSTRGVALNGVEFSAPAPVNNILGAYTLAPFDDAGGHINVHQGYHYHASTSGIANRHTITQDDGHSELIGYALDGYGIYALYNSEGEGPGDLDNLRGQYDDVRGYHYHVDEAGSNNFINGLRGVYAVQ